MPHPLLTLLLPGLDGTGRLFEPFVARASGALDFRILSYPPRHFMGYEALAERALEELPKDRPFALLGESFGGPLAIRVAAASPPGLVGLVLTSTFHRRPAPTALALLRLLSPAYFHLPLPAHAVRLLLAGPEGEDALVREVQSAVASVKGAVMAARAREAMRVDASDALRRVNVPVLFLGGKRDRLLRTALPIEVRALRADVEIRMLEAPHLVLQTRPAEAMAIIEEFLGRCVAGGGAGRADRKAG